MNSLFVSGNGSSCLLWFSVMACCVTLPALAAERRGRAIEFSAPRSEVVSTNLEGANAEKLQENLLRQKLQEGSSRTSGLIDSRGSLDGAMDIPYQPSPTLPVQNKRVKELLDQRKNWIFLSPEEVGAGAALEETFGVPKFEATGERKAKLSVVERFYQRLEQDSNRKAGRAAGKARPGSSADYSAKKEEEESPMARRLIETENALKRIFDANPTGDYLSKGNDQGFFSDWFSLAEPDAFSFEGTSAQKARLEEFKQLLESRPALGSSPKSVTTTISEAGQPNPAPGWSPPAPPGAPTSPSGISDANGLGLTTLPGLNSVSAGQPNYAPPPLQEPQRFPQPVVPPPQRKF